MMALRDTIYVKHVPDHSPRYATRRVWASTGMDHMMNEIHLAFRSMWQPINEMVHGAFIHMTTATVLRIKMTHIIPFC